MTRSPSRAQIAFVKDSFFTLAENLFRDKHISRQEMLAYKELTRDRALMKQIARDLYGPMRECIIPHMPSRKIVLLSLKEMESGEFDLLVFKRSEKQGRKAPRLRCFVGHRFTREIEERFRWNLRELFDIFEIDEEYSRFDGSSLTVLDDIRRKIKEYDFCLFDNRETTTSAKPNVYIEAGMALAFERPFIFCHHREEVWPSDFSNVFYFSYRDYKDLFQQLYALLPIFLSQKMPRRRSADGGSP